MYAKPNPAGLEWRIIGNLKYTPVSAQINF